MKATAGAMKANPGPAPCPACPQRTWRSIAGFMVMGCGLHGHRFGTAPDLRRGRVNKAGGCVGMPGECEEAQREARVEKSKEERR